VILALLAGVMWVIFISSLNTYDASPGLRSAISLAALFNAMIWTFYSYM
jgi:hypothetical protein